MNDESGAPQAASAEEAEKALEWMRNHPFGDQDENGIDLSLLRSNLKLSPTQRVEKMRGALRLYLEIERDRRARHANGPSQHNVKSGFFSR